MSTPTPAPARQVSLSSPSATDADHRRATIAMLGVVIIWGINVSVMKLAVAETSPLAFNAIRFPLGMMALWFFLRRSQSDFWPTRSEWPTLILLGVTAHPIYQLCFLYGLWLTSASHAAILVATTPVWAAIGDRIAFNERLPRVAWLGIGISLGGVLLLTLARSDGGGDSSLFGDALVLVSGMIWSFYMIRSRPLFRVRSSLWVTAWAMFIGAPIIIAMGIPAVLQLDWGSLTWITWGGAVYAGLFALATAYSWTAFGVKTLGASRTAVFINLIPVVALAVAALWLGERLSLFAMVAAGIALIGVWITTVSRAPRAPAVLDRRTAAST